MYFVLAFGQTCPNSESDEGLMHTVTGTVGVPVTASHFQNNKNLNLAMKLVNFNCNYVYIKKLKINRNPLWELRARFTKLGKIACGRSPQIVKQYS